MLLADESSIEQRRALANGPLAPLADSLAADLDRLLPDEDVFVPREKARMTRRGGRCERDGSFLEFDPRSPFRHRCPMCGTEYKGDEHYRWWIMGYQLWLAERAVHAAALWRVRTNGRHRALAEAILLKLAAAYLEYPNQDNVLGPGRVFFSTYLESIWSLQLSLAVSLLEGGGASTVAGPVRERILAPSSELVASYDEGLSNRQVWNAAALGAAGLLLDKSDLVDRALHSTDRLLREGMLADGTWYEGENYHLFAHRGLWHLVQLATASVRASRGTSASGLNSASSRRCAPHSRTTRFRRDGTPSPGRRCGNGASPSRSSWGAPASTNRQNSPPAWRRSTTTASPATRRDGGRPLKPNEMSPPSA